jgi:hypothetical protein
MEAKGERKPIWEDGKEEIKRERMQYQMNEKMEEKRRKKVSLRGWKGRKERQK